MIRFDKCIKSRGDTTDAREKAPEIGTQLVHDGRFIDRCGSYLKSVRFSYLREEWSLHAKHRKTAGIVQAARNSIGEGFPRGTREVGGNREIRFPPFPEHNLPDGRQKKRLFRAFHPSTELEIKFPANFALADTLFMKISAASFPANNRTVSLATTRNTRSETPP